LYRIVTNLCYNRLPRLQEDLKVLVSDEVALQLPDDRQPLEAKILSAELNACLRTAIDELPDGYRLLINLRHLQEMSYEEIAQVTGLPLGTVKTGIHRARLRLKSALEEFEVTYESL
jgi:RNA polymerase sigma-70 factor (ECF subfamily)